MYENASWRQKYENIELLSSDLLSEKEKGRGLTFDTQWQAWSNNFVALKAEMQSQPLSINHRYLSLYLFISQPSCSL